MIIDSVSDLHGFFPKLEGGDLLIVGGDLTARHSKKEFLLFSQWIREQNYKNKVVIPGNHDTWLDSSDDSRKLDIINWSESGDFVYLVDSGVEIDGFKIWGSPWTKRFEGMNPLCMAFTVETDEELAEKWSLIPDDTNILVTHSPEYNWLDCSQALLMLNIANRCGSRSLGERTANLKQLQLHVVGHIHEGYGRLHIHEGYGGLQLNDYIYINASHVTRQYKPINKPIRVELFGNTE